MRQKRNLSVMNDPLWYKDAVIYQLHVKSFFDANNDGVGDFPGPLQKLDYIAMLGVTAIWMCVYDPSPRVMTATYVALSRRAPDDGTLAEIRRVVVGADAAITGSSPTRHQPHLGPAFLVPARPHG